MKKTLALLLALCMLLAALPVLAEESVSGSWYLVMFGMTAGTINLNEDGTCVMEVSADGTEQKREGSWTQEKDQISLSINNETMALVHEGDKLTFSPEELAAMGLNQSAIAGGSMDLSMLSSLLQITRTPGKITLAELNAYQDKGALPEGKTKEDMDALQEEMLMTVMTLLGGVGGAAAETPGPELTVLEENFYVRDGYGSQEGVYIAKVQNDHDAPVYLSNGSLVLMDADKNVIGQADYLGITGSCYLEPGEATYVSMTCDLLLEGLVVDSYTAKLETLLPSYQIPDLVLPVAGVELRVDTKYSTAYYAAATVTNSTDKPMANICAVSVFRSADGKLLDIGTTGLYQCELAAGSTVILVNGMDGRTVDYCEKNSIVPAQAEALAWIPAE